MAVSDNCCFSYIHYPSITSRGPLSGFWPAEGSVDLRISLWHSEGLVCEHLAEQLKSKVSNACYIHVVVSHVAPNTGCVTFLPNLKC